MNIQRISRTDAEKVYIVCRNVEATSLTIGQGVRYVGGPDTEQASNDGISVLKRVASAGIIDDLNFAGIVAQNIISDGYGLVQAYGVCSIAFSFEGDKTVGCEDFAVGGSVLKSAAGSGLWTSSRPKQFAGVSTSMVEALAVTRHVQLWTTVNISGGIPMGNGFVRAL